jgi:hypothetical protein
MLKRSLKTFNLSSDTEDSLDTDSDVSVEEKPKKQVKKQPSKKLAKPIPQTEPTKPKDPQPKTTEHKPYLYLAGGLALSFILMSLNVKK